MLKAFGFRAALPPDPPDPGACWGTTSDPGLGSRSALRGPGYHTAVTTRKYSC